MLIGMKNDIIIFLVYISNKLKINYLVFALLISTFEPIIILFFFDNAQEEYLKWLFYNWKWLYYVCIFMTILYCKKLSSVASNIFLNKNIPYPHIIKDNMYNYLIISFMPYINNTKIPKWYKKFYFIYNYIIISIIIGIIGGLINFVQSSSDPTFCISIDIIQSFRVSLHWFLVTNLAYIVFIIIGLLRKIYIYTNDVSKLTDIYKTKKMNTILLNLFYAYCFTILPLSPIFIKNFSYYANSGIQIIDLINNKFLLIMIFMGIILFLVIPLHYSNCIIKKQKRIYEAKLTFYITQIETNVIKYDNNILWIRYNTSLLLLDTMYNIKAWSMNTMDIFKMILSAFVGFLPLIIKNII